jgi:hypothetical protein
MIKAKSNTRRQPTRAEQEKWQQAQEGGWLLVRLTDNRLAAANIPAGFKCLVRVYGYFERGALVAVRSPNGSVDIGFFENGNTRRTCLLSADGTRREIRGEAIGRVVKVYPPQPPVLRVDVPTPAQQGAC